jgi:hypothetical protein
MSYDPECAALEAQIEELQGDLDSTRDSLKQAAKALGCTEDHDHRVCVYGARSYPELKRLVDAQPEQSAGLSDAELMALAAYHFGQSILMEGDNQQRAQCGESPAWTGDCKDEYGDLIMAELERRGTLGES